MVARRNHLLLLGPRPHHPSLSRSFSSERDHASVRSTETARRSACSPSSCAKRDVAAIRPRRRRVRFDLDERTDDIKITIFEYDKVTEQEKDLCWITKQDVRRNKQQLQVEASQFKSENPNYVSCLERLFDSPLNAKKTPRPQSQDDDDASEFVSSQMSREDAPRGLEYRMSALIHRHKLWTTQTVLRRQSQLRHERTDSRADALAFCCQHIGRCTRELALEYGKADALQAQKVYRETLLASVS